MAIFSLEKLSIVYHNRQQQLISIMRTSERKDTIKPKRMHEDDKGTERI